MNNLLWGFPFSQEDKLNECMQVLSFLGKQISGNFADNFHWFVQVFVRDFLQKISHIQKEWLITAS